MLTGIILVSMASSLVFSCLPLLKLISPGFRIILLTLLIAGGAAFLVPVEEEHEA